MIFYGTKGTNIRNGQIINTPCPNCNSNATMNYSYFAKYAHIYMIPFFPYTKLLFVECNNCKKTFSEKELSKDMETKLIRENEKNGSVKFPLWTFSGAVIVLLLSGFGIYQSKVDDDNEAKYIKDPKKGDVYFMKLKNGFFTTLRIDEVKKDSLYVTYNNYETDLESGIDKINIDENYKNEKYVCDRKVIEDLFKKDTIYTIERN